MEQSQLVELIKVLSQHEKDMVRKFCALPFFEHGRRKDQVIALLDYCLNQPWHNPEFKADKNVVERLIFKSKHYAPGTLEKIMVDAQKVVRSYLAASRYFRPENAFQQNLDFSEEIRQRGLWKRYESEMDKLKKIQENHPYKNVSFFFNQFQFETAIHYVACIHNQKRGDLNIPNVLLTTETFYYLRKVALLTRYLLQLVVTKLDPLPFIQEHLENMHVPERCINSSAQLEINYRIFNVLKDGVPSITDIDELFALIKSKESSLDVEELQEFYAHLRNFAVLYGMNNRLDDSICYRLHDIYLDNLSRGFLYYEGKLTASRLLAIIDNSLRIGAYEWTLKFIEQHKHQLFGEKDNSDAYHLAMAQYLFSTGQYDQCLDFLPATSSHTDILLISKRTELKALFELQTPLFHYKLDAFKMFLSRTSSKILSPQQKRINLDFLNMLVQIDASIPGDTKRAQKLIKRLTEKNQAVEWRWLLHKATAIATKKTK